MSRLICTVRFVSRAYPIINEIKVSPQGHTPSADVDPFIFFGPSTAHFGPFNLTFGILSAYLVVEPFA